MTAIVAIDLHREGDELLGASKMIGEIGATMPMILIALHVEAIARADRIVVTRVDNGLLRQILLPDIGIPAVDLCRLPLRFHVQVIDCIRIRAHSDGFDVKRVRFYASIVEEPKAPTHFVLGAIPKWGPP